MDGAYGGDYFKKEVMGRVIGAWTPFYGLAALGSFCSDAFRQESIDPSNLSVGLHKIQQKGRAMNDILNIVWILILIQVFIPFVQKRILAGKRLSPPGPLRHQERVKRQVYDEKQYFNPLSDNPGFRQNRGGENRL